MAGIFGEDVVDVVLDASICAWIVKATDGRVLLQVPWLWAYDQRQLGKRTAIPHDFLTRDEYVAHRSRWEAFEVCMCAYPLTAEDKRVLDQRFPGISTQRQYRIQHSIWQPEQREAEQRPQAERSRAGRPAQQPVAEVVVANEPAQTPEIAPEAGERRLLL